MWYYTHTPSTTGLSVIMLFHDCVFVLEIHGAIASQWQRNTKKRNHKNCQFHFNGSSSLIIDEWSIRFLCITDEVSVIHFTNVQIMTSDLVFQHSTWIYVNMVWIITVCTRFTLTFNFSVFSKYTSHRCTKCIWKCWKTLEFYSRKLQEEVWKYIEAKIHFTLTQ